MNRTGTVGMKESVDVPAEEVMRRCAANHTRMAARTITRAYDQALEPCGLTVTQFTILVALTQTSFDSISRMANQMNLERSSLSRNLTRLEERNLVQMTKAGRAREIEVTDEGTAKVEEAYPLWKTAQEKVERVIGSERWSEARSILRLLAATGETI